MNIRVVNKSKHKLPAYSTISSTDMDIRASIDAEIVLKPLKRALADIGSGGIGHTGKE